MLGSLSGTLDGSPVRLVCEGERSTLEAPLSLGSLRSLWRSRRARTVKPPRPLYHRVAVKLGPLTVARVAL
ncbi:MAG: hypothetical protein AAGH64_09550 [Planctomycetota bacterium]